jgi:hypothetical protein
MGHNVWKQRANRGPCLPAPRSCVCSAAPASAAHILGLFPIEKVETLVWTVHPALWERLWALSTLVTAYEMEAGAVWMSSRWAPNAPNRRQSRAQLP